MKVQNFTPAFSTPSVQGFGDDVKKAVQEHPLRLLADTVDIGAAAPLSLGLVGSSAAQLLQGTSIVMGAGHGISAFWNLISGLSNMEYGYSPRAELTRAAGETLSAVGMFTAAAGVGPVSLAFLGLGLAVSTGVDLTS
ncbi:MAG: hypothetical protein HY319_18775 [Armatimonadetes bacterium]|nr:hypothetical protein [Armatimonadota bacterium]